MHHAVPKTPFRPARNAPLPISRHAVQLHHLLPMSLQRRRHLEPFFLTLRDAGFALSDGLRNGLWLPAEEGVASAFGMALHRGPHPRYTNVVAARVERIMRAMDDVAVADATTMVRLDRLQRVLARLLAGRGPRLILLNRRDPLRLFADYSYLDAAIARAWTVTPPAPAPDINSVRS